LGPSRLFFSGYDPLDDPGVIFNKWVTFMLLAVRFNPMSVSFSRALIHRIRDLDFDPVVGNNFFTFSEM